MARPDASLFAAPPRPDVPERLKDSVPPRTAWIWQPPPFDGQAVAPVTGCESGQELAPALRVFHDGKHTKPDVRVEDGALVLEGKAFDGGYMSFAFGFGGDAAAAIEAEDLIRAAGRLTLTEDRTVFVRLNLVSGPTRITLPIDIDYRTGDWMVEWDVLHTDFDADRGRDGWVDLIVGQPRSVVLRIEDLYFLRHPRASF